MYDSAKQVFINQLSMGDNMFTHFAYVIFKSFVVVVVVKLFTFIYLFINRASNTAGFFAAVAATPIDVIKVANRYLKFSIIIIYNLSGCYYLD